jgi:hypothetical protein
MRSPTDLAEPPAPTHSGRSARRWWLIVAVVVALALGTYLLATEPGLRSAFPKKSSTWLTLGAVAVGWFLVAWFVIRRFVRNLALRTALIAIPPLVFSVWALAPAFFDKTVNEDFPVVAGPAPTTVVPDDAVTAPPATVPATTGAGPGAITSTPPTVPAAPTTAATPTAPVRLAAGTFSGLAGHEGTGDAVLYRLPDGSNLVRLENLDLQNGPDLVVYLVPRPGQTELDGAVSLGDLKGNKGNQNYPVPSDVDPTQFGGVLVWCRAFSVEFAGAPFSVM